MIITVDGLAASGKGTLARALGDLWKLPVLDTGSLWRVLALQLAAKNYHADVEIDTLSMAAHAILDKGLDLSLTDDPELRTEQTGQLASIISGFARLRTRIDYLQKDWVAKHSETGGILDGRETGISIAPQADHKFFLFADVLARARRRADQIGEFSIAKIKQSIEERDKREITRFTCPVRPAMGAVLIDTTYTSKREMIGIASNVVMAGKRWDDIRNEAFKL